MIENLKIIYLTKSLLRDALVKNTFWDTQSIVPFSKSKANWLLANSRIEEKDLCGIIAYEGNELISFIYLIPDLFNTPTGIKKLYWVRTWWVAENYSNSVLSTYTLTEAIRSVDKQVIIKFLSKDVQKFYEKQPYFKFSERNRYFIIFNLDSNLIVGKFKFLKKLKPLLNYVERITLKLTKFSIARKTKKKTENLIYEYISELDEEAWAYLENKCKNDIVFKTREYINWQLSNSQYTKTLIGNKHPYHCLAIGSLTEVYPISLKIIENKKVVGFISVLIRNNEFVVKYFITEDTHFGLCINVLMEHFIYSKANTIHTENEVLGEKIKNNYSNFYCDIRPSYSLVHKKVEIDFKNVILHDRDGHFA